MLLPRKPVFGFGEFAALPAPVQALFDGDDGAGRNRYESLRGADDTKPALACALNLAAALSEMTLAPAEGLTINPLESLVQIEGTPQRDRLFVWADARLCQQVKDTIAKKGEGVSRLVEAPAGLHEGATFSAKQTDFGEANVQFSFHEKPTEKKGPNKVECMKVDIDIDYFSDTGAHLLLEVFPNTLKGLVFGKHSSKSLTDPARVYGLRWNAGIRRGRDFNPSYVID
jgi:hypothetical protein